MASYTLSYTGSQIDSLLGAVSTAVAGNGIVNVSGLNTTLGNYLTSTSAASTYLSKTDASSTYLSKTDASSTYLTQSSASSTYLTQSSASSTYLSKTDASSTYLTQSSASSTYFAKSNLSNSLTSTSTTTAATSKAIKDTNDKIAYSATSFNCTTSMTVNSCVCYYYNFTLFKIFVISIKATSTCGRTRHTVTLPSGYSFGTLLLYQTISNDNNAFSGFTKEFNCPLWVSGSTLYLDIHKGSGLASTYDPPALNIYILSK